jgi:hypothetical protein
MVEGPVFRSISPAATPDEVAAIVAAISSVDAQRRGVRAAAPSTIDGERIDAWVSASRLTARRAGLERGPWRLSGRIGRRSRA